MNPDEIAKAARGDINADLLTGTGSGGLLSTGYFEDTVLIDVLEDDETLQYLAQNLKNGLVTQSADGKTRIKPGGDYRSAILVTDKRVKIIIGGSPVVDGDWDTSLSYEDLTEVEYTTGFRKYSITLTTASTKLTFFTRTKHDVAEITDYLQAQISAANRPKEGADSNEEPIANSKSSSEPNQTLPDPSPIGKRMYAFSKGDDGTPSEASSRTDDQTVSSAQSGSNRRGSSGKAEPTARPPNRSRPSQPAEESEFQWESTEDRPTDADSIGEVMYAENNKETGEQSSLPDSTAAEKNGRNEATTIFVGDQNGEPIEGAEIQVEGGEQSFTVATDENGHQTIELSPQVQQVDLEISKRGYELLDDKIPYTAGSTVDVTLDPLKNRKTQTVQLLIESPSNQAPRGDTVQVTAGSFKATEKIYEGGRRAFDVPETYDSITIEVLKDDQTIFEAEQDLKENIVFEVVVPESEEESNERAPDHGLDREALLEELKKLDEIHYQPLSSSLVTSEGEYDVEDFASEFGSWSNAKQAYEDWHEQVDNTDKEPVEDYETRDDDGSIASGHAEAPADLKNKDRYSKSDVLSEITRIRQKIGGQPTTSDLNEHGVMSATVAYNFFDSWNDAVSAADRRSTEPTSKSNGARTDSSRQRATSGRENSDIDQSGDNESTTPPLSSLRGRNEGRIDELIVRVDEVDWVHDDYYTAHLRVSTSDLENVCFDIWQKHDVDIDFESGVIYRIEQARVKTWGDSTDKDVELSSTRSMVATSFEEVPHPPGSDTRNTLSSSTETGSTTTDTEEESSDSDDAETDIVDEIMDDLEL